MPEELKFSFGLEAITLGVAVCCVIVNMVQQWWHRKKILTGDTVMALLNGASIVPFLMMVGAAVSPQLLEAALSAKGSMSLAGGVGLLFVLGEVFSPSALKKGDLANL